MSRPHLYVLREERPVAVDDVRAWADWFETADAERRVAETKLIDRGKDYTRISTCFLGVDHDWTGEGPPILWETAVFARTPEYDVDIERRYASRLAAMVGHRRAVANAVGRETAALGRKPEIVEIYRVQLTADMITDEDLRGLFAMYCECRPLDLSRREDDHAAIHDCDTGILHDVQIALGLAGSSNRSLREARENCAEVINRIHATK